MIGFLFFSITIYFLVRFGAMVFVLFVLFVLFVRNVVFVRVAGSG